MRSVQLVAKRTLEVRDVPQPPEPGPGEVLVKVRAVGICGSDLHWYMDGGIGATPAAFPQVLGHEPAGQIVAAGPGVENLKPGQKVAVEPAVTCGNCEYCLSGHHNNCRYVEFMSTPQLPGLLREYAVVPARNAVAVPAQLSFAEVTVLEPLSVMLHILELAPIRLGETVAVLGAGPIGLLMAHIARMSGASRVFIADRVAHRLRIARELGIETTLHSAGESVYDAVMDLTRGRGVDTVFDAAGALETINLGIGIARLGGRFILIGIPTETITLDVHTAMNKELDIQTVRRSNHNIHGAIDLMLAGRIPIRFITHRFPLEQAPCAFQILSTYADGVGKTLIEIP